MKKTYKRILSLILCLIMIMSLGFASAFAETDQGGEATACEHGTKTEVEKIDATCGAEGSKAYWVCSECNKKFAAEKSTEPLTDEELKDYVIPATGEHTLEDVEAQASGCTTYGYDAYKHCTTCDKYFSAADEAQELNAIPTTPPKGHGTLNKTDAKAPSCEKAGNKEYWSCETCGKIFADENGTEVLDEKPILDKIGSGKVAEITKYGTINETLDTITVSGATIEFATADATIGRSIDSWWVGIYTIAPEEITADNVGAVMYSNDGTDDLKKSFGTNNDGIVTEGMLAGDDYTDDVGSYYMQAWGSVSEESFKTAIEKGSSIKYIWRFDWDGDGAPDQDLTLLIDTTNLTLTKDGKIYLQSKDGQLTYDEGNCTHASKQVTVIPQNSATCTEDGAAQTYWTCQTCQNSFSNVNCNEDSLLTSEELEEIVLKATGHQKKTYVEEAAASCYIDGMKAHYICTDCGTLFKVDDSEAIVTAEDLKIPASHTWKVTGNTTTCEVCGYSETVVTQDDGSVVTTDITVDENGKETQKVVTTTKDGKVTSKITYYADGSYKTEGFTLTMTPASTTYSGVDVALTTNDVKVNLKQVKFNGSVMDSGYYTISGNPLKITVSATLLKSLPGGIYQVDVTTTNGTVSSLITVNSSTSTTTTSSSPKTGDTSNMSLYVSLLAISMLLAAAVVVYVYRKYRSTVK